MTLLWRTRRTDGLEDWLQLASGVQGLTYSEAVECHATSRSRSGRPIHMVSCPSVVAEEYRHQGRAGRRKVRGSLKWHR